MTEEQKAQTIEFFTQLLNGEIPEETEIAPDLRQAITTALTDIFVCRYWRKRSSLY